MDRTQLKTLVIKIGAPSDEAVTFFCVDTNAPVDYDGFGTMEITRWFEDENDRYPMRAVLVRDEHLDWQLSRYSSGMHTYETTIHDVENIAKKLWKKLSD